MILCIIGLIVPVDLSRLIVQSSSIEDALGAAGLSELTVPLCAMLNVARHDSASHLCVGTQMALHSMSTLPQEKGDLFKLLLDDVFSLDKKLVSASSSSQKSEENKHKRWKSDPFQRPPIDMNQGYHMSSFSSPRYGNDVSVMSQSYGLHNGHDSSHMIYPMNNQSSASFPSSSAGPFGRSGTYLPSSGMSAGQIGYASTSTPALPLHPSNMFGQQMQSSGQGPSFGSAP